MKRFSDKLITIFLPSLGGGGAERSAIFIANGLVERGYQVHLVIARNKIDYLGEVSPNVDLISLNSRRVLLSFPAWLSYLNKHRPKIVLSFLENANLLAIWAKILSKLPAKLVISEHSLYKMHFVGRRRRKDLQYMPFLIKSFYPFADVIVAVSQAVAYNLIQNNIPEGKIKVINNPIDIHWINQQSDTLVDHQWFREKSFPIILSVGRLVWEKNFELLMREFRLGWSFLESAKKGKN